jgi:hypothetical protein
MHTKTPHSTPTKKERRRRKKPKKMAEKMAMIEMFLIQRSCGKRSTAMEYIEEMIKKQNESEVHKNTDPIAFEDALYSTLIDDS